MNDNRNTEIPCTKEWFTTPFASRDRPLIAFIRHRRAINRPMTESCTQSMDCKWVGMCSALARLLSGPNNASARTAPAPAPTSQRISRNTLL